MSDNEKCGFKKPPKHTRFKKGTSGNKNGRPKKNAEMISDMLIKALGEERTVLENGKRVKMTMSEAYIKSLIAHATKKGDPRLLGCLMQNADKLGLKHEESLPPVIFNITFAPPPDGEVPDPPIIYDDNGNSVGEDT